MTIQPTRDQIKALAAGGDGPVVMLNLLRFKEKADDGSGTGEAAYGRYSAGLAELVKERGGEVVFLGRAAPAFVGDAAENEWDAVLLVRYPSRASFLEMIADPRYAEAHPHRDAGLADTVLIPCDPMARFG